MGVDINELIFGGLSPSAPVLRRGRLYSPDLNPIENSFSKIKACLRKTAARTIPKLWDAIGKIIPSIKPKETQNYFINAGYNPI